MHGEGPPGDSFRAIRRWVFSPIGLACLRSRQRCSVQGAGGHLLSVLVSCDGHQRAPQTWWLKTIEVDPLTVLETRSPKSRCCKTTVPLEAPGQNLSLPPPTPGGRPTFLALGPGHSDLCLWAHTASSSPVISPLLCLHRHVGFRAHWVIQDELI